MGEVWTVVRACLKTNNDETNLPVGHAEARGYLGRKLPSVLAQCVVTCAMWPPPRQLHDLKVVVISASDQTIGKGLLKHRHSNINTYAYN